MTARLFFFLLAAGIAAANPGGVHAQEPQAPQEAEEEAEKAAEPNIKSCINVRRIRRSRVLDDNKILLEMRGGQSLVMTLKRTCPQLAFHEFFSYRAHAGRLCARIDHIVTRAGFTCTIESFSLYVPETPEEEAGKEGG